MQEMAAATRELAALAAGLLHATERFRLPEDIQEDEDAG
jgi:hypothetical protein